MVQPAYGSAVGEGVGVESGVGVNAAVGDGVGKGVKVGKRVEVRVGVCVGTAATDIKVGKMMASPLLQEVRSPSNNKAQARIPRPVLRPVTQTIMADCRQ